MSSMATKIFDNPANAIEKEIAETIKPLLTPEIEEKIEKDKLTLAGCWQYCHGKGKSHKVGNCAKISPEQHFKWMGEYFGIKNLKPPTAPVTREVVPEPAQMSQALSIDFDSLFD